ncbi:MAG: invasion associated locus B family protein [Amylibacter sp.]|nr:invasion associated locus B family protein [Amylibacter sp.]
MHKILLTSLFALSLSTGTAVFSQDTTTETTTTQTTTTQASPDAAAEDQTFPVAQAEENQIGKDFIKEEHGDWKVLCTIVGEGKAPNCRLLQILDDANGGSVAELSIIALSSKAQAEAGVNFVSPLGTLLTSQLSMRVDSGQVKRYPFSWCEAQGCVVRFGLTKAELGNLKKGNVAVMTIVAAAAPKTPLALNVSLKGFTAAWNTLKEMRATKDAAAAE